MKTVNIHEAKTHLSQLLVTLQKDGESYRICKNGEPVADLIPIRKAPNRLKQDAVLRKLKILYDPATPLTPDEWPAKYRS